MREASFVALPTRAARRRPRWSSIAIALALGLLVVLVFLIGLQAYVTSQSFEASRSLVTQLERQAGIPGVPPGADLAKWAKGTATWQTWSYRISFLAGNVAMLLLVVGCGLALVQVSRKWESERALREARQAVLSAERDRGRFLAAAGHDLRQPLQAMNLFLGTLAQRVDDPYAGELVTKVRAAARSMDRMLTGLLDVAKLDAGIVATDRVAFPLRRLVDGFIGEFARLAEDNGLELRVGEIDAVVRTDPVLLESILRNLLANAIKYTAKGSVLLSCRCEGGVAVVSVQDTGPGIPEAEVVSIFDDFYRVAGTASRSGGLGLGLGIVRRMAKLIGTPVGVVSKVGAGTSFTLEVPLAEPAPVVQAGPPLAIAQPAESRDAALLAGRSVMLVEDDDLAREALNRLLASWRMEVVACDSSDAACALFEQKQRPKLEVAVVDYHIGPGMTGPLLLDHLAAAHALAIPAILMTGSDDPKVLDEIEDSGYPCLRKPLDPAVLQERLLELLDRRVTRGVPLPLGSAKV